jgi:hypothetical protein
MIPTSQDKELRGMAAASIDSKGEDGKPLTTIIIACRNLKKTLAVRRKDGGASVGFCFVHILSSSKRPSERLHVFIVEREPGHFLCSQCQYGSRMIEAQT